MADSAARAPFPTDPADFNADDRVSFSLKSQTYLLEDERGEEWEWLSQQSKWVPMIDEALVEQQRDTYRVEGVDEDAPAMDVKKRKAEAQAASNARTSKKQKAEQAPKEHTNTAVYVTSLPEDADLQEIQDVFCKYGMLAESIDSDQPRIKLYHDEDDNFKGEALIVYYRPESVNLAINMLDETNFRLGQELPTGPMRVREADASYKVQKTDVIKSTTHAGPQRKGRGGANRDRDKVIKKNQEMNNRLANWDSDDDNPSSLGRPELKVASRWDKIVVLKHVFTPAELAAEPTLELEFKEDIRDECSNFGEVTNVVIYGLEPEGIVTVRFADAPSAQRCIAKMHGRHFDEKTLEATTATPGQKFRKRGRETQEEEAARLERFGRELDED